jgi:serine/threonine protein kinase
MEAVTLSLENDTDARIQKLADTKVDDIDKVYKLGDELGRGRFSVVQAATHIKENAKYAIKVVENDSLNDEENLEALETEVM